MSLQQRLFRVKVTVLLYIEEVRSLISRLDQLSNFERLSETLSSFRLFFNEVGDLDVRVT